VEFAETFSELRVYKLARKLAWDIFFISQCFPKEEMYSLTDQIRRASRSVAAQIAEAWAKRMYEKHFISKLSDADGEQLETQHWITTALDCDYISSEKAAELINQYQAVGKMVFTMMDKADLFALQARKKRRS
jgi:four helix bundle protein